MEINKNNIYLFFKGELSLEQSAEIRAWADESEENYAMLQEERMVFDIINLASDEVHETASAKKLNFVWKAIAIAACCVSLLSTGLFLSRSHAQSDMLAETVVTSPLGARSQVILPDGTQVWLNSGSTIRYSAFPEGKGKREVELDGMARFDVSKDAEHPFVVHTYLADIEVLGTSFDVTADSRKNKFETALFTGKVTVSDNAGKASYELAPSQILALTDTGFELGQIEDYDVYSWVDGLYCFKEKPLSQILADMESYFDISIKCNIGRAGQEERLTGKFRMSDGLDYALRVLQLSTGLHFSYDVNKEEVTITE